MLAAHYTYVISLTHALTYDMSSTDEGSLVARAQRGDREALGHLWDLLTPKLFGYLVNTLRDRALAEDVLQTTWLKAIGALPGYTDRKVGMSAWLFTIARNECQQLWRKGGREVPLDVAVHDTAGSESRATEEKILVEQALSVLSEEDRELLRLRYIADLPVKDIAAVLNINVVGARVRIHRALGRARLALTV
jgi:RNA polymerase sigma factor (sigma-70 family)